MQNQTKLPVTDNQSHLLIHECEQILLRWFSLFVFGRVYVYINFTKSVLACCDL